MSDNEASPDCGRNVYWWEGEYEGECQLPEGHEPNGIHFDGLNWFDDANEQVAIEKVPAELRRIVANFGGNSGPYITI